MNAVSRTDTQLVEDIHAAVTLGGEPGMVIARVCQILMPTTMPGVMSEIRLLVAALDDMIEAQS